MRPIALACCTFLCVTAAVAAEPDFNCLEKRSKDITVVETTLAGVPALLRVPKVITRPPIVLWHGFGPPDSEQALMQSMPLDEVSAAKVYLGLPLFGARSPEGGSQEVARRQKEDYGLRLFEPAVMGASRELPAVLKALEERNCLRPGQAIGLFGFSAGGGAVLVTLAAGQVRVGSAVTVNATTGLSASIDALQRTFKQPYTWSEESRQLAKRSDAAGRAADIARGTPPPALLIVHGGEDRMLPPRIAVELNDALRPHYRATGSEQRLQLTLLPQVPHNWSNASAVTELRKSVAEWFERYLGRV